MVNGYPLAPLTKLDHLFGHSPTLPRLRGTLMNLHGPPNGPQNGPCEANFRAPLVKKGPAGSDHGQKLSIFLDRSHDNGQT